MSRSHAGDVHVNPRVRQLGPSATLAINERSAQLQAEGRQIFRLGLGQSPFPVPELVVDALKAHAAEKDYLPVRGLPALREAVAAYQRRLEGLATTADDVIVGPGTKELMFLLSLAYEAELLLPSPSWVSYAPQAQLTGRAVRWIPTELADGWRLTPAGLAAACADDARRILLLNYPNNPTGTTYDAEQLEALAAVAREKGVVILSDEIYGGVHHEGRHVSIARFYPEGTVVSNGLSKWCGAGGWRLGAFCFPPQLHSLRDATAVVASETFTSVSAPIQYASVPAFGEDPALETYLRSSRRVLRALGGWVHAKLAASGARLAPPQGGFYLFPDFSSHAASLGARGVSTGAELCERLLEDTGVAMLPGSCFGRRPEELSARLAYVDFDGGAAIAADPGQGDLDEGWLRSHCGKVLEAIDRTCDWLVPQS
jgi:aspartate aminotransferase